MPDFSLGWDSNDVELTQAESVAWTGIDVLSLLQGRVIEPRDGGLTWPSELWTPAEVRLYLHEQQTRVLRETGCLISIARIPDDGLLILPGTTVVDLPSDCIQVVRIGWTRARDGYTTEIPAADLLEADLGAPTWIGTAQSIPIAYSVGEADDRLNARGDLNRLRLIGGLTEAGWIDCWYIGLPAPLAIQGDDDADRLAAADLLTVPDVGVPALVWGTLETMTAKVARAAANPRASYAREMRGIAVEAMQVLLRGWEQ